MYNSVNNKLMMAVCNIWVPFELISLSLNNRCIIKLCVFINFKY
jgi:hypothetical protein